MALLTRSTLKNLFKRGMVPTEVNFSDLIDSTVNKVDDGFAQSNTDGFMLSPQGPNQKLMSFYESIRDPNAAFSLSMNPSRHSRGLSFNDKNNKSLLFLRDNGNVGIGTTVPHYKLEVDGIAGIKGRVGTHAFGDVPADGNWHAILSKLEGMTAFEIIAQVGGRKNRGKYAMTYAVALCAFGSGKIHQVKSSYNWFFQKIRFRWRGKGGADGTYRLEIRTAANYGYEDDESKNPIHIRYYISKLWDETLLPENNKVATL